MELLRSALLPTTPFFTDPSPSQTPINPHTPKFKFRASTDTTNVPTTPTLLNPQPHLAFTAKKATDFSPGAQPSSEVSHCISLLRGNHVADCRQIHALALKLNAFEVNSWVGNKLATLYSKNYELLDYAQKLFYEMPKRTVPTYAALISAYCHAEQWEDLFLVFRLMVDEGMVPDVYVVPTLLKACALTKMVGIGKMIHGFVIRKEMDSDVFVGNSLIDFYANCGDLGVAVSVFGSMRERDVVSWTALVSAFMNEGLFEEATEVFDSMKVNGVKRDLISWNALVSGFAQNGEIDLAFRYLEAMQEEGLRPRVNSWNGVISGCIQNEYFEDALDAFYKMLCFPEDPNCVTIASILSACVGLKDLNLGKAIHGISLKRQLCGKTHVEGSLIGMYSKCGMKDYAEKVFSMAETKSIGMWNEMIAAYVNSGETEKAIELLRVMHHHGLKPDVVSYNTILAGHARNGQKNEAYELLNEMVRMDLKPNIISFNVLISGFQQFGLSFEALKLFCIMQFPSDRSFADFVLAESIQPNSITIAGALAACADLNLLSQGKEIHGYMLRSGFEPNVYISSALVDMYSKCLDIVSATKVFRRIEDRNTICWNAMIAGHVNNMQLNLALELFCEMLEEGLEPSSITLMILLLTCGDMTALRFGRELHGYIIKSQLDQADSRLASALVGMYAKCGSIKEAKSVFDLEVKKDALLWNAMLSAYSTNGMLNNALALVGQMELVGVVPEI
ncbi:pentatricopeptide repeat-containing protein At1g19720-like [Rosa rugosa]|uniref:pentatricopeptide repeat-containing protein At1g19720-like n=1 Tax=Rosa rugosa TaxID=74645 RepID=UPI002B417547|nr:pentatricopeptide repeat-containing protein At1g19720-like [Rosa rugosa]XP_062027998.1 pentatricopeptide repeat-containing protein At1g19720-like [Rosa rugosa]